MPERKIIDCAALVAKGLWNGVCCAACHHGSAWCADSNYEIDIGDGARLLLCCASGSAVALSGSDFAKLRGE